MTHAVANRQQSPTAVSATGAGSPRGDTIPKRHIIHENYVYVFDASTGVMVARVSSLRSVLKQTFGAATGRYRVDVIEQPAHDGIGMSKPTVAPSVCSCPVLKE